MVDMDDGLPTEGGIINIEASVRDRTGGVAFAGALLVFFGFFFLARPQGDDLFHKAGLVFYHTLRCGGLFMVFLAIWLSLGHPLALAVDAASSIVVGVLFIVTGVLMAVDGGPITQLAINLVCGAWFVTTGIRNGKEFLLFLRADSDGGSFLEEAEDDPWTEVPSDVSTDDEGRSSLRSVTKPKSSSRSSHPPPDGYLADLAREDPPIEERH